MKTIINNQTKQTLLGFRLATCSVAIATVILLILTSVSVQAQNRITKHLEWDNQVIAGSSTYLEVTTSPAANTYIWQVSTNWGSSWTTIDATDTDYTGQTSNRLNIPFVHLYMQDCCYRVICGWNTGSPTTIYSPSMYSSARLNVKSIVTQPSDKLNVPEFTNTSISAGIAPPLSVTYNNQWYFSSADPSVSTIPLTEGQTINGCTFTNVTSNVLTLTNVTTHIHGGMFYFQVNAPGEGRPNPYQPGSNYDYMDNSEWMTLTVKSSKPTPEIIEHPAHTYAVDGLSTTFSVALTGVDQNSYEYQWYYCPSPDGMCDYSWPPVTDGGVFSGANTPVLTIDPVSYDYNGYHFRCEVVAPVWGYWTESSIPAKLTVEAALPGIVDHPRDRSALLGSNTLFGIATAYDMLFDYRYQWQHRPDADSDFSDIADGGIYSGATTLTLSLSNIPISYDNYEYRCIVTLPKVNRWIEYSNVAKLTLTELPKITTTSLPEAEIEKSYNVTLTATGTKPILWSLVTSSLPTGLLLDGETGVISGIPTKSGPVQITVRARNIVGYDTKVFSFTVTEPPQAPPVIEITPPSTSEPFCTANDFLSIPFKKIDEVSPMKYSLRFSEDAKAAGFKDTPFANLPADMAFKIDVPKGAPSKSYAAAIIITREGTGEYRDEYPFTFSITNNGVVIVNQPPEFQSICGGASIALSVDIAGKASDFQWYINGQAIAGAKSNEYLAKKEGIYYVEVRGECGELRSTEAIIASPSSIPGSVSVRVKWGTVLYVENATGKYQSYQWYRNGVAISGATSVYVTEKDGFLGEYYVRCFKSDGSSDETCPVVFDVRTRGAVGVYPSVIKANEALNIQIADPVFASETLTGFETLLELGGIEATVEIYSLLGVKVYSTKINTPVATIQPNFHSKGNYFVIIKLSSGEVFSEKIIVQ